MTEKRRPPTDQPAQDKAALAEAKTMIALAKLAQAELLAETASKGGKERKTPYG